MPIVGAYLGGPEPEVAAGFTGVSLCVNTRDRQNLSTASFRVTNAGYSQTFNADSTGRAFAIVPSADVPYQVDLIHDGEYMNDDPQHFIARSGEHVGVFFDLYTFSESGTVVRVKSVGETVTGTSGSNSMEATVEGGIAEFRGLPVGSTWTFTDGYNGKTIMIERILMDVDLTFTPQRINIVSFDMSFDSTTFNTDPEGCLAYTKDCIGFTPVSSPPSSLGPCSVLGSWDMNDYGSSENPFLDSCFYATFDGDGNLHERLNPKNLAEIIGFWDPDKKGWVSASGASSIESENTMFCFPALYRKGDDSSVTIGTDASSGTAYGATIDGHTYQYEAIGVYEGYVQGSKLMSLSGKASSQKTRPYSRTLAAANNVKNGLAMLWNFHQWRDWWHLYLFGAKSFNGQVAVGQGGFKYDGGVGQGLCNAMGLWAGSSNASDSTATSVKALIENPWGYKYEFIDDFVYSEQYIYVGQNSTPDDTTSNKTAFYFGTDSGWQSGLQSTKGFWGLGIGTSGSSTTCQCDQRYSNTSSGIKSGYVGGYSTLVYKGFAGPSCLSANGSLSYADTMYGARLAFVFDLEV